jgi:hypothetical protein
LWSRVLDDADDESAALLLGQRDRHADVHDLVDAASWSPAKLALKYGCSAIASAHARTRKSFTLSLTPDAFSFSL